MKLQRMKDVVLGAAVASLVMGAAPVAFAKAENANIPVIYNNIKIVVDGKELSTSKEPFIYEGTTYLPVRAVAEAVGKDVNWDSATQTVTLSGQSTADVQESAVETAKEDTSKEDTSTAVSAGRVGTVAKKTGINENGIKIKCKNIRESTSYFGGIEMDFDITNSTSMHYSVSLDEFSINGKSITAYLYADVEEDRTVTDSLRIYDKDLKEAGIEKMKEIRMSFRVFNFDSYEGFDTKEAVVTFK